MELIDKAAVVAEIKTRIETYNKGYANGDDRRADALETFLHDIDFFEVKEVDLEKEYDNEFFKDPVFGKLVNRNAGIGIAKHFFFFGLKTKKGE